MFFDDEDQAKTDGGMVLPPTADEKDDKEEADGEAM